MHIFDYVGRETGVKENVVAVSAFLNGDEWKTKRTVFCLLYLYLNNYSIIHFYDKHHTTENNTKKNLLKRKVYIFIYCSVMLFWEHNSK